MTYALHRVSCKVALFNAMHTKVLIVQYAENIFGLPGGHLEVGEHPDEAMKRELQEELGLSGNLYLIRDDFWFHPVGKVVLGYVGMVNEEMPLILNTSELSAVYWVNIVDIRNGIFSSGSYDEFVLKPRPFIKDIFENH